MQRKPENFENITFSLKIYNRITETPKSLSGSEKKEENEEGRKKAIPRRFTKVKVKSLAQFSLILAMLKYEFSLVDIGSGGRQSDGRIFNNSALGISTETTY